jgi:kynurenine formamidase
MQGDSITRQVLEQHDAEIEQGAIVLFKTTNSALSTTASFNPKFVFLHVSGAQYLRDRGTRPVSC